MSGVVLWVAVGLLGGVGAVVRLLVDADVQRRVGDAFPTGILVVNLTGAFALGVLGGADVGDDVALLAGTALLGAYTTFSTWMLDTHRLAGRRATMGRATLDVAVSLLAGLGAAALGVAAGGLL